MENKKTWIKPEVTIEDVNNTEGGPSFNTFEGSNTGS